MLRIVQRRIDKATACLAFYNDLDLESRMVNLMTDLAIVARVQGIKFSEVHEIAQKIIEHESAIENL